MRTLLVLAVTILAACQSSVGPTGPATTTGTIVARDVPISIGTPPTLHVRTAESDECGTVFLLTEDTRIFRTVDGDRTEASVSELTVGRRVSVWAEFLLKSCPGQSSATAIEIID